jgi:glycogen(starch) synthase
VLEAMAAGLPVVATKVGAVPEMIRDGETGRLVEIGDAGGLARSIIELATDPSLRQRMGAHAAARVAASFDFSVVERRLAQEYASVVRADTPVFDSNDD